MREHGIIGFDPDLLTVRVFNKLGKMHVYSVNVYVEDETDASWTVTLQAENDDQAIGFATSWMEENYESQTGEKLKYEFIRLVPSDKPGVLEYDQTFWKTFWTRAE